MAGVLFTSQPLGENFRIGADNAPGLLDAIVADSAALPAGPVQPFRAQYYVDPAFVGTSTGSASNPFTTIAAAFAAGAALAVASAVVIVPANAVIAENVVFPSSGAWELTCAQTRTSLIAGNCTINGTITLTTTATAQHALTGLNVTGNVSGNAGATTRVICTRCAFNGSFVMTTTAGNLRVLFTSDGPGVAAINGLCIGPVTIAGGIVARGWRFLALVSLTLDSELNTCLLDVGLSNPAAAVVNVRVVDIQVNAGAAFTAPFGTLNLFAGGATTANLIRTGGVAYGPGVVLQPLVANATQRSVLNNNLPITNVCFNVPLGLMVIEATLTLLVPGTAGAAVLNAVYTDLLGVLQTKPVTPALNIASAAGTEVQGVLAFSQNGASANAVSISVTGIVTPGPLSYSLGAQARTGL